MTVDLDERLRSDLPRLADHLLAATRSAGANEDGEHHVAVRRDGGTTPTGRRWLRVVGVAAALVFVVGTASVVAVRRETAVDPGQEVVTSVPDATAGAEAPEPTGPGEVPLVTRSGEQLVVSVSLYSGVPDPVFTPTPSEESQVLDLLRRLQPPDGATAPAPSLGFRGFAITGLDRVGDQDGRYRVEVWGTTVSISGYDESTGTDLGTVTRSDPTGALFELLLTSTEQHLDELGPADRFPPAFVDELRAAGPP